MSEYCSITEVARMIGIAPKKISAAFYTSKIDPSLCPMIGARRVIPRGLIPRIRQVMGKHGARLALEAVV